MDDRNASSCRKPLAVDDARVGGMQCDANEASLTSPSVDLMLKVEKAERRLHEIVVAEVAVVLDEMVATVVRSVTFACVHGRRHSYTSKQKADLVAAVENMKAEYPERPVEELLRMVRTSTQALVQATQLKKWSTHPADRKRGPKVNTEFEEAVLGELVFTSLMRVDSEDKAVVVANVIYHQDVILIAAKKVLSSPSFRDDAKLQKLKLSRSWVAGWLRRNALRKRRVTATAKELPPPEVVQVRMMNIQRVIIDGAYTAADVLNGDETGMVFGAQPRYQYVSRDASRAVVPESDEKSRFTTFVYGNAEGEIKPSFSIIKCSAKNPADLFGTRVIPSLHCEPGFRATDGWMLKLWQKDVTLPNEKRADERKKYRRPYLIHAVTGDVITCQNNAWMDSIGVIMLIELVVGPSLQGRNGIMIWDNCAPHKVAAVREACDAFNLRVETLPPKMTDQLQVMDLVVNGPLKAAIRKMRAQKLFTYFQEWKIRRLAAAVSKTDSPPFKPPAAKLAEGLQAVLSCMSSVLRSPTCKESIAKCFVRVGLWPRKDTQFVVYSSHVKAGTMSLVSPSEKAIIAEECDENCELTTFGEIATGFETEHRYDHACEVVELEEDGQEPEGGAEVEEVDEQENEMLWNEEDM